MDYKYVSKIIKGLPIHDKSVYQKIKKIENLKQEEVDLFCRKTASIINRLSQIGTIKNRYKKNLCILIFEGVLCGEIKIISINSHALSKDKNILRDKLQYNRNYEINIFLKKIERDFDVRIAYVSVLADLDVDFRLEEYKERWVLNKEHLREKSKTTTVRLSELMKEEDFNIYNNSEIILEGKGLEELIEKYEESKEVEIDFSTPKNFIRKQITSYVIVGMILEKRLPDVFILDVQKKYYPFEQPFYNYSRDFKVPIVYCGY